MRINFDRLSQLAGLPSGTSRRGLYEGKDHGKEEGMGHHGMMEDPMREMDLEDGLMREDEDEDDKSEAEDHDKEANEYAAFEAAHSDTNLDEVIEVDEVMLVQELRRAKRIMNENKRRSLNEARKRNMFEAQLRQVIDEEVQNVMDEMNLTSGWVYGDKRPRNSRKGYTNQGSMLPGIGFRRR